MYSTEQLDSWHQRHAWQPFTQMQLEPNSLIIEKAEGLYLHTNKGQKIIDAIGSWWVSIHGHNHPYIIEKVKAQLDTLDQVMYAGFTHEPAAKLSARLSESTNHNLSRIFYSDNGACSVEIALKMAFQYFANSGRPQKSGFVTLDRGYHGDTIGTMSVGARSVFHKMYEPLLFKSLIAPAPMSSNVQESIDGLEEILKRNADSICGLILEPLIQGAGGMNIYPSSYLTEARRLCDLYEILLIADEVFTGFGRTGTMYACEAAGIWPDIMALSKGLSAGVVPFAATVASEKIFQAFSSGDRLKTLFHGHSMTANPSGCAAANASLDLMTPQLLDRVIRMNEVHSRHLNRIMNRVPQFIRGTRHLGSVAAIELNLGADYVGDFSPSFRLACVRKGLLVRPLGNVVYICPPYATTDSELDTIYGILEETILEFSLNAH